MPTSFPGISKGGRTRAESPAAFPSGLLALHEPSEAIVDLVFVHGLSGDRERTWASGDESGCWPKEPLPAEVPKSRILTFGYDAYITRSGGVSKNKIRDHARDLVNQLANARMTEEKISRPIIFVVHSLGGIVCKDALQVSTGCAEPHLQAIAAMTRAILFAATPHEGSPMADWAKVPASTLGIVKQTNLNLLKILQTTSEVRDRIHDDFLALLRKRQLQDLENSHGILWIKGKPGSGKSTLMKFLAEKGSPFAGSLRLLFFFNARGIELERSLVGLYRSFILQLVKEKRSRPAMKKFLTIFEDKEEVLGEGKCTWKLTELQDALNDALISGQLPPLELLVDALDECDEDQVRRFVRFIDVLMAKALAKGLVLNVCWSSRHYPTISIKNSFELHVEEQNASDIQKFVHAELAACGTLDEEFQFEEEIVERSRGVFLWATLVVQKFVKAADQGLPRTYMLNLLKSLPMELDELLQDIFQSIDPDFRSDTLHLIQWTLFAKRPLYLEEIPLALRFSTHSSAPASLEDFSSSLESWESVLGSTQIEALKSKHDSRTRNRGGRLRRWVTTISGGLIEVTIADDGQQYLQVIHESVRHFLLQPHVQAQLCPGISTTFSLSSSKTMFEACGRFILCPEFRYCLSPSSKDVLKTDHATLVRGLRWIRHPFTRYALEALTSHGADAEVFGQDLSLHVKWLWIQLYRRWLAIYSADIVDKKLIACRERFDRFLIEAGILANDLEAARELHCAVNLHWVYLDLKSHPTREAAIAWDYPSFQDFDPSLEQLISNEPIDDRHRDLFDHFAVHNQDPTQPHFSILELQCFFRLLERAGEKRTLPERFPVLFWAVKLNKPDTIRDLLQCAFDVNEVNHSMGTPLYFAITQGHLQSVAMLLSMGAAVDNVSQRPIPLLTAAEFGRDEILTLLLERGANLQCFNVEEQCALAIATKAGHHSTMELLLHHGAAVNAWDYSGKTALYEAAKRRDSRATLLLLSAGATVIRNDELTQPRDWEISELQDAAAFVKTAREVVETGIDHEIPS